MYDVVGRERASRLYGLTYLDSKTIVCGNNGSNIVVVHDTERLGRNRYIFRTFQLDTIDRGELLIFTGSRSSFKFVSNSLCLIPSHSKCGKSSLKS